MSFIHLQHLELWLQQHQRLWLIYLLTQQFSIRLTHGQPLLAQLRFNT